MKKKLNDNEYEMLKMNESKCNKQTNKQTKKLHES